MARFRLKSAVVEAERVTERSVLESTGAFRYADTGDWLVTNLKTGKRSFRKDTAFREAFEPMDKEARELLKC